jgi:hypothetical protein
MVVHLQLLDDRADDLESVVSGVQEGGADDSFDGSGDHIVRLDDSAGVCDGELDDSGIEADTAQGCIAQQLLTNLVPLALRKAIA